MSTSSPALSNSIRYYSAHRGPVFGTDGKFHHFARQCDPVHLKNGYWKFSTYDDDRRAFRRGLSSPEEVLKAQDTGDGDYDDIMLRWVPGELDVSNKSVVGTASVHLQTIYNERKLLGKTLSSRGAIPLYPLSTDPRLFQYRVTRYGIQKGMLPNGLLAPTSPSPDMPPSRAKSPTERVIASSTLNNTPPRSTNQAGSDMSSSTTTLSTAQTQSESAQGFCVELARVQPNLLITGKEPEYSKSRSNSDGPLRASIPIEQHNRNDAPFDPLVSDAEGVISTPTADLTNESATRHSDERFLADYDDEACLIHDTDVAADDTGNNVAHTSLAASTPANLFHAQVAALPCMDCGCVGAHASDCWINKAMLSLKPPDELTVPDFHRFADDVRRFDPGPWTTHHGPQQELVEDTETRLKGMAEIIRNLDTSADDPELQELDDLSTVLLWAFKAVGNVQILERYGEKMDAEMLDM